MTLKQLWPKLKPGDVFISTEESIYTRTKIDKQFYYDNHQHPSESRNINFKEFANMEISDYLINNKTLVNFCDCNYYNDLLGLPKRKCS